MSAMRCPDDNDITLMLQGGLSPQETEQIQAHLDTCEACSELFSALFSLVPEQNARKNPTTGERSAVSSVGRYVISALLGAGAMGAVFEAWDPELERRVAIKLLRPDRFADAVAHKQATERLLREARALASLDHPNLLTVYDVGVYHRDNVFIASAFIEGETADVWARTRSWQEIVACYEQVCRGLSHAHARGIIHRDIKPQNILVDPSGRARVCDFGLAKSTPGARGSDVSKRSPVMSLTQTGAVVGTPAYMAPEQLDGQPIGAAADQHAVCACLYEALYGFRPFSGETLAELAKSVRSGDLIAPKSADIPRELFDVIARGLSPRAHERHEDMRQLEARLRRVREASQSSPRVSASSWRVRVMALILLFLMAVGVGVMLPEWLPRRPSPKPDAIAKKASEKKRAPLLDVTSRASLEHAMIAEPTNPHRASEDAPEDALEKPQTTPEVTNKSKRFAARETSEDPQKGTWDYLTRVCQQGDRACGDCVASARALLKSGELRSGVAYAGEGPVLAIAARCAHEEKDCAFASTLLIASREPAAHINASAKEDARRQTATQLGWSFPECPLVYKEPELRALQASGVLARAYGERSALRCERAWGKVEREVASWAPERFDLSTRSLLLTSLGATSACLAESNCALARRVWVSKERVLASPSSRDASMSEFARVAPRCIGAEDDVEARVAMFVKLVDRARDERDPGAACATLWTTRRDALSSLAKSVVQREHRRDLDSALTALARCAAPSDCEVTSACLSLVQSRRPSEPKDLLPYTAMIAPSCVSSPPNARVAAFMARGMLGTSPSAQVRAVLEPWITRGVDRNTGATMEGVLQSLMTFDLEANRCDEARATFSLAQQLSEDKYTEALWTQWAKTGGCSL